MEKTGKTADEVLNILNKESGLLGLTGTSSDLRDLTEKLNMVVNVHVSH